MDSPKLDRKVYNIYVKDSVINDFNANDIIYGIAYSLLPLELFVRKFIICYLLLFNRQQHLHHLLALLGCPPYNVTFKFTF